MPADAVFDAEFAEQDAAHDGDCRQPPDVAGPEEMNKARPRGIGQTRLDHQVPKGEPSSEKQNNTPVDIGSLFPIQGNGAGSEVGRQNKQ